MFTLIDHYHQTHPGPIRLMKVANEPFIVNPRVHDIGDLNLLLSKIPAPTVVSRGGRKQSLARSSRPSSDGIVNHSFLSEKRENLRVQRNARRNHTENIRELAEIERRKARETEAKWQRDSRRMSTSRNRPDYYSSEEISSEDLHRSRLRPSQQLRARSRSPPRRPGTFVPQPQARPRASRSSGSDDERFVSPRNRRLHQADPLTLSNSHMASPLRSKSLEPTMSPRQIPWYEDSYPGFPSPLSSPAASSVVSLSPRSQGPSTPARLTKKSHL